MNNLEKNQKPKILFDPRSPVRLSLNNNVKVILPTIMRLLVNDSPAEHRAIVEEAAQTLELVLQAVEKGIKSSQKVNQVVLYKLSQAEEERKLAKSRELRRIERSASVKKDLELNKAAKEERAIQMIEERKQRE